MNPKNTLNISCAISFRTSEAAFNKKEKQKSQNMLQKRIKRSKNPSTAPTHKKTLKYGMQTVAQHHLGNKQLATSIL